MRHPRLAKQRPAEDGLPHRALLGMADVGKDGYDGDELPDGFVLAVALDRKSVV